MFLNLKFQLFGTPKLGALDFKKQVIFPARTCHFTFFTCNKKQHWKYSSVYNTVFYPEAFVAEFENARVWANQGAVITSDNILVQDVSREYFDIGKNHGIFKQWKIAKPTYYDHTVAVLSTSGCHVYYHWIMDVLPRYNLLKLAGCLDQIDYFVLDLYARLPFQIETLKMLNIDESRIINSDNYWKFHIRAKKVVVPSLIFPNDCPSIETCVFLREMFAESLSKKKHFRRIYLKRANGRTIINEPEVLSLLNKNNFEIVQPETLSVADQALLFSEAEFVIAPHGAGLTNVVFCQPGTKVIDLFSPLWVSPSYGIISNLLGLKYGYLVGESKKEIKDFYDPKNRAANVPVNIEKLNEMIRILNGDA